MKQTLSTTKKSGRRIFAYALGFGLWWAWYDFFRIADSHLLPLSIFDAIEMNYGRIAISLGFNISALAIAIGYRRILTLLGRRNVLLVSVCLETILSIIFYSPTVGVTIGATAFPIVSLLLGILSVPLFMAWFEFYSLVDEGERIWNSRIIPKCLIIDAIAIAALLISHFFLPPLVVAVLHMSLLWFSYYCLTVCKKQLRVALPSTNTTPEHFTMPKSLLLALFGFGTLFGLVLSLPSEIAAGEHAGIGIEVIGILIAACAFLGYWHFNSRKTPGSLSNAALSLRYVIVPFTVLGVLLLPLIAFQNPYLVSMVFWAGYDYLDILMMVIYIEMSRRLSVSPLATNAQGQFADSFGISVGMVAGLLLAPFVLQSSSHLIAISIVAVMLIIIMSQWIMTDRKISTFWGLLKVDPKSYQDDKTRELIAAHAAAHSLTSREEEVLFALFSGKRPEQISAEFGVSVKTVRSHIYRIYNKLDVHSHHELIEKVSAPPSK